MFRESRHSSRRVVLTWLAAAAVLAVAVPALAGGAGRGTCVTLTIQVPFELPDGSVHAAGALRICDSISYSPVSSLHATYVDGAAVGFLSSERRSAEAGKEMAPTVYFEQDASGTLRLLGYVLPSRRGSVSYRLASPTAPQPRSPELAAVAPVLTQLAAAATRGH